MISQIRLNYFIEAEDFVNHLVSLYLQAFYTYLSMGFYFSSQRRCPDPVVPFFRQLAKEKHKVADNLLVMQTDCGGCAVFHRVQNPPKDEWKTALEGMEASLALEKKLNQALLELHTLGRVKNDPHFCFFLRPFLDKEVKLIQEMGDRLSILRRAGIPEAALSNHLAEKLTFKETGNAPSPGGL